jgi:hypothetical protein
VRRCFLKARASLPAPLGEVLVKVLATCIVSVLLFGCGSSTPIDVSAWLGSWSADVNETETCPPATHNTPLTGTILIVAGTAAGTIVTEPPNACNLTWTVTSSSAASIASSQTCNVFGSAGGQWTPTFTSGSLGLSGSTIAVNDTGTATLVINSVTANCTFVQSGSFTR